MFVLCTYFIYIFIHVFLCMYFLMYVFLCTIFMDVFFYVCIFYVCIFYVCILWMYFYVFIYGCIYVFIYGCIYGWMDVRMYVCMCVSPATDHTSESAIAYHSRMQLRGEVHHPSCFVSATDKRSRACLEDEKCSLLLCRIPPRQLVICSQEKKALELGLPPRRSTHESRDLLHGQLHTT